MVKAFISLVLLMSPLVMSEPLLKATESWDGGEIAYPDGKAEISAQILRLKEGSAAPFHCHPVPTMGYVLSGTAEIETTDGDKTVIGPGEPLVEVMRTVHRGIALNGPVEILVFYAGAEHVPNTVLPANDQKGQYCLQ